MHNSTIVIPCYNEAQRLDGAAFRAFVEAEPPVGFLFVDDGSTDQTAAVLNELAADLGSRGDVMALAENHGKGEAVRRGMLAAIDSGSTSIGYWDADLATPLAEIMRLRQILMDQVEIQVAIGSRVRLLGRRIDRSPMRHYAGRIFATFASMVCRLPVYDTQCGAKLLRVTDDVREILSEPFATRWTFDVELLARYERRTASLGRDATKELRECALEDWRDVPGSKLRARDFLMAGCDLIRIWRAYPPVRTE